MYSHTHTSTYVRVYTHTDVKKKEVVTSKDQVTELTVVQFVTGGAVVDVRSIRFHSGLESKANERPFQRTQGIIKFF